MENFQLPYIDKFKSQKDVDEYVMETEELAEQVDDEDSAIELYQHLSYLRTASEYYFVPDIIFSWEEMALSYIESPAATFQYVYYEQLVNIHKSGLKAFQSLEQHVLTKKLSEEVLFNMIYNFNDDIRNFNKYCKKYHQKTFDYYKCNNDELQQKYILWLG